MSSHKCFSDHCSPELCCIVCSHVEKLTSGAVSISFTTDIWSSSQVSMLSVTAHWLDEDYTSVLHRQCLHSKSHVAFMYEPNSFNVKRMHISVSDIKSWTVLEYQLSAEKLTYLQSSFFLVFNSTFPFLSHLLSCDLIDRTVRS